MSTVSLLASGSSSSGSALSFLILPLIFVGMYFVLIRPQRKRMKEQQTMQSAISTGDEVITSSGIYGFITAVEDDFFWLEIDDDVQVRIAKAAIQGKVTTSTADADADDAADADEDAES